MIFPIFEDSKKSEYTGYFQKMRPTLLVLVCILSALNLSGQSSSSLYPSSSGSIIRSADPFDVTDSLPSQDQVEPLIYIPNIFSPNGDGTNDLFQIQAPTGYMVTITRFFIFDKRGTNVYTRYNIPVAPSEDWWDGSYKHFTMSTGVYAYYLEVQFDDGQRKTYKGNVTLLR